MLCEKQTSGRQARTSSSERSRPASRWTTPDRPGCDSDRRTRPRRRAGARRRDRGSVSGPTRKRDTCPRHRRRLSSRLPEGFASPSDEPRADTFHRPEIEGGIQWLGHETQPVKLCARCSAAEIRGPPTRTDEARRMPSAAARTGLSRAPRSTSSSAPSTSIFRTSGVSPRSAQNCIECRRLDGDRGRRA